MKDIICGLVMTAPFIFGFFVVERMGRFLDEADRTGTRRETTRKEDMAFHRRG